MTKDRTAICLNKADAKAYARMVNRQCMNIKSSREPYVIIRDPDKRWWVMPFSEASEIEPDTHFTIY